MPSYKPHWSPDADYSSCSFFIRRMDTVGYYKPAEAPVSFTSSFYSGLGPMLVVAECRFIHNRKDA